MELVYAQDSLPCLTMLLRWRWPDLAVVANDCPLCSALAFMNKDTPRGLDPADLAALPPIAATMHWQAQEISALNGRIEVLQRTIAALHLAAKDKDALENRVVRLCEANQNLVLATLGAQDMQASAEGANRRQTEFLSMLAHELRNPLAPIAMANDMLGKFTDAEPGLLKLQAIIARQVTHMARLLDDLLDAARIDSGKVHLDKRPTYLDDVIQSAVETGQPFIDQRCQHLVLDLAPQALVVDGDLVRLAQSLSNLIINAAKYSPESETIRISTRVWEGNVLLTVKDNGMGIAAPLQESIFGMFVQGFRSLERSQGGLGIGLSLVRSIVDMHGGKVEVVSEGIGLGSEFIITLPLADGMPVMPVRRARARHGARRRILIIEDNLAVNDTLRLLLEEEGYVVTAAANGPDGLARATDSEFDFILCDIGLPGMNGFDVVDRLRRSPQRTRPRCFAISGYNQDENRVQALQAGFEHYFVKPIDVDALLALLAQDAGGPDAMTAPEPPQV